MRRAGRPASVASLLNWPERQAIAALESERRGLLVRMARLAPRSAERIVLQARLQDVVARILRAQIELKG